MSLVLHIGRSRIGTVAIALYIGFLSFLFQRVDGFFKSSLIKHHKYAISRLTSHRPRGISLSQLKRSRHAMTSYATTSEEIVGFDVPDTVQNEADRSASIIDEVDYCIIGSGIGGLACAAMLSYYGYSTLVLESHYLPGNITAMRHGNLEGLKIMCLFRPC